MAFHPGYYTSVFPTLIIMACGRLGLYVSGRGKKTATEEKISLGKLLLPQTLFSVPCQFGPRTPP